MTTPQQRNLQELVTEVASHTEQDSKGKAKPTMSHDFMDLVERGLHHVHMPSTLHPKAAEALQLTFEAMGGLPRMMKWADQYPASFYKLFARMVIPTITPVLPPPQEATKEDWPEWLSARRLAYQEAQALPEPQDTQDGNDG